MPNSNFDISRLKGVNKTLLIRLLIEYQNIENQHEECGFLSALSAIGDKYFLFFVENVIKKDE